LFSLRSLLACLCLLASASLLADQHQVEHRLSFEDRKNQYLNVQLYLPVTSGTVQLAMPNWTPGSYLIQDYAAQVERLQATGSSGKTLNVDKTSKNSWLIDAEGESWIQVRYSVWAGELAVNSSWLEQEFGLLNGAGVFLYSEETRTLPQLLNINLPAEWRDVHVALPSAPQANSFLATSYDELIDSPILLGNMREYRFQQGNQEYSLVNQGETALWDGEQAAADIERIVETVQGFWKKNPLEREYIFMNIIANGSGGLEHDYSTVMLSSPWQMRNRDDYIRWLSLVTHEFFHVWNVRRLRPQALNQYDYNNEIYTRELWLAEGLSSYYDNLLLFRSGLITVEEYLELLAAEILAYELSPGRKVRSAEQASFDAWIKHYKPDANSINSDVSYYRKGSLIGFVADTAIRKASEQEFGLDDIMREMYRLYGPSGVTSQGYPPGAFEALIEQRVGNTVGQQIKTLLTTVTDPDVDAALDYYGLELDRNPGQKSSELSGIPVPVDFGLTWSTGENLVTVESVILGGAGADAGVLPGDELLAINGQRVNAANFQDRILRLRPEENAILLLARHNRIIELPIRVQNAIPVKYRIIVKANIKGREKQRMSNWLGMELAFIKN